MKMIILTQYKINEKIAINIEEIRQVASQPDKPTRVAVRYKHPQKFTLEDGHRYSLRDVVFEVTESIEEVVNMINDVEPSEGFLGTFIRNKREEND